MSSPDLAAAVRAAQRVTRPAPHPADVVQAFVNTRNALRGYDLLEAPAEAELALRDAGFAVRGLTEADLARLRGVREALRSLLRAHATGEPPASDAVAALGAAASDARLQVTVADDGSPGLAAASSGVDAVVEEVLAAVVRASSTGVWSRLKACADDACGWVFHDASRNRSGTWCVMGVCGARAKMRRYRGRASP